MCNILRERCWDHGSNTKKEMQGRLLRHKSRSLDGFSLDIEVLELEVFV